MDRPAGDQMPSPAMGGLAIGSIGAGAGRWGGPPEAGTVVATARQMAPAGGVPPTLGWWWLYHWFSAQLTTEAPPFWRAHSAKRALSDPPNAGLLRAAPSEMP